MRILHWVVVKVMYQKPHSWVRVNKIDIYPMWLLLTQQELNWVKFILDKMNKCMSTPSYPLLYSSFVQYLLDSHNVHQVP